MFEATNAPREGGGGGKILCCTAADPGLHDSTIILPGQTEATLKRYKYAINGMSLTQGERVFAVAISGTYVLIGGRVQGGGAPGVTFIPAVSNLGVISWTNDGGLPNPPPVNIMGPQGIQGIPGPQGIQGIPGPKGDGMYAFEIRADGNLYCIYDTATPPAFSINSEGDLIYTIGGL